MPDIPGNSSTTASITIGGTANDVLEVNGDHDWFRIDLTAGQKITITLDGITLEDPLVRILSSGGTVLGENDDISPGVLRDSRLVFTAQTSGTFFIDVGAFDDDYSGAYQLAVNLFTPPSVATLDTIAEHLTDGYWGGDRHHFNATQGGTITVNVTALTAAGRTLARDALALWSDIIGVTFSEVTTGGQIVFDDNETGAFTDGTWSDGITISEHVNVSTQWLATYGSSINTYSFQTYIHEIGHALGLGHGGYYNTTATYPDDALFANDGWPTTIMSYFDQEDNTYFANQGYTFDFLSSPMVADIRAMADLYGLSTTTRTGDTTYGFGNDSGRAIYTANLGTISTYTVFDSGGIDTLNYSGFEEGQRIDLTQESFSNVGGGIGNVSIAFGTVIENVIAGSGSDTVIGNAANNVLNGGGGTDTLSYETATAGVTVNLALASAQNTVGAGIDTISNFERLIGSAFADTLTASNQTGYIRGGAGNDILTPASEGDWLYGEAGDDTFISGPGFDNFDGGEGFNTVDFSGATAAVDTRAGQGGADGVDQFTEIDRLIGSNFDDFLELGGFTTLIGGAGNDTIIASSSNGQTLTGGTGNDTFYGNDEDLNNDTITDLQAGDKIVIRDATLAGFAFNLSGGTLAYTGGSLTLTGGISGTLVASAAAGGGVQLTIQSVVPVNDVRNDFNGDGRSDILWRSDSGQMSDWLANANGNGGFVTNDANAFTTVPTNWHIVGTGDFNGDTRDDILWRNDAGQLSDWLGQVNGGFVTNDANAFTSVPTNWHIVGTGDFNGDTRDDILWRNDAGQVSDWLGQANGGFATNDANAFASVPTNWHIAGTGDFNGDGRDDILWRNDAGQLSDWLGQANGGFVTNDANAFASAPTNWHIVGTGDFNGDNRDDILWRSDSGQLSNWLGQANGGFIGNDANAFTTVPTNWTVVSVGDFNGDNRDDILWRNNTGQLSNWLGTATGGFTNNDANAFSSAAPTSWHVQPEHFLL